MESYINKFRELIKEFNKELKDHKLIAPIINCDKEIINLLDDLLSLVNPLEKIIEKNDIKINYLNNLQSYLLQIIKLLPLRGHNINNLTHQNQSWNDSTKKQFESNLSKLKSQNDQLLFNLDFFNKINFFSSNIVAIGANGSGKTTLSNKFKNLLQNNGVVIPAQRILLIPDINTILNPSITADNLREIQQRDKTNKNNRDFGYLQQEFGFIINNLLAENTAYGNKYRLEALELSQEGKPIR